MIFESLSAAAEAGELLLVDGGMCHFHRRRDGQVTIREIIVLPGHRRRGIGRQLVEQASQGGSSIVARCPADLEAGNAFWGALGFGIQYTEKTRAGRTINVWQKDGPCA